MTITAQQVAQWEAEQAAARARIVTAENKTEHYRQEAERLRAIVRGFGGHFVTLEMVRSALEPQQEKP